MAEAKDKTTDSKVFDVAKPDKPTIESGKPTIVPTRTVITAEPTGDTPDVEQPSGGADKKEVLSPSATKIKIQPISKPEDLKPEKQAEPAPGEEDEDELEDDDNLGSRNKLKNASTDEQDLIDRKAAERQANLDKIAEAKTYYLPINQVVRRRSKHIALAGVLLIIIMGLAWADVALDAGLITIPGVKAPTHFFSK